MALPVVPAPRATDAHAPRPETLCTAVVQTTGALVQKSVQPVALFDENGRALGQSGDPVHVHDRDIHEQLAQIVARLDMILARLSE